MIHRNWFWIDFIQCCSCLFVAAERFVVLLLGYWGHNMVIRLSGWGLARWIFIGVSMEKEWSGRQCLSITGLRVWRQRLRDAGRSTEPRSIRCYITHGHTYVAQQVSANWWEKVRVYMCSFIICRQTLTRYLMCFLHLRQRPEAFCWCISLYPPPM